MLLIIPASGDQARKHFEKTILRTWNVRDLKAIASLNKSLISKLAEVSSFGIWGALPGILSEDVWKSLEDWWAIFYQEGRLTCWGKIFAKVRDRDLAEKLWGKDERGRTWEYVYFIKDMKKCNVPWDEVRKELGYQEGFIPRGHTPVNIDRLHKIIEKYGSIEGFLKALRQEEGKAKSVAERYNPYLLQGPWILREDLKSYLKILGLIVARLTERSSWSREDVKKLIKEEGIKLKLSMEALDELARPRFLNDLRRLGLLLADDPIGPWKEADGVVSELCNVASMLDKIDEGYTSGAVALKLSLSLTNTPCTNILREIKFNRTRRFEEVIDKLTRLSQVGEERIKELLKLEEEMLSMAEEVISKTPRSFLPIELWDEAEEADIVLASGKSLLLAGAPAVGKTRYARRLAMEFTGCEPVMVTGRGDLSYDHLVYSYELVEGSSNLILGKLSLSILASWVRLFNGRPPKWMFIDELNRFNVELVLGELFTALDLEHRLGHNVLPGTLLKRALRNRDLITMIAEEAGDESFNVGHQDVENVLQCLLKVFQGAPLPLSWRILATINLVDRSHLFRLGFALLRRFPILLYPSILGDFEVTFNPPKEVEERTIKLLNRLASEFMDQAVKELGLDSKATRYDRVVNMAKRLKDIKNEVLRDYEEALKTIASITIRLIDAGVEIGAGLLVDTCKLALIAKLVDFDEARIADLAVSSILLPQVGSLVPTIKSEVILMGNSARLQKVNEIMKIIKDWLGNKSRSANYAEVLKLELPLTA